MLCVRDIQKKQKKNIYISIQHWAFFFPTCRLLFLSHLVCLCHILRERETEYLAGYERNWTFFSQWFHSREFFFFVFGLSPSKKNETSTKSVILLAACCLEKLKREHFFGSTCDRNDTKQKKKIHKQKSRVRWALASTRGKNYCQDDKAVLWRRWDETKLHLCFAYYFWYAIQLGKANDSISYEKGNLCAVWQLSK